MPLTKSLVKPQTLFSSLLVKSAYDAGIKAPRKSFSKEKMRKEILILALPNGRLYHWSHFQK